MGRPSTGRAKRRRPHALTLLEVLISLALAAVLLSALWSVVDLYSKLSQSFEQQTERMRVIRSVFETIATDLQQTVPLDSIADPGLPIAMSPGSIMPQETSSSPPVSLASPSPGTSPLAEAIGPTAAAPFSAQPTAPREPSVSSPAARVGLRGDSTWMQLDVIRPPQAATELSVSDPPVVGLAEAPARPGQDAGLETTGLETIVYSFSVPEQANMAESINATKAADPPDPASRSTGLVRRGLPWPAGRRPASSSLASGSREEPLPRPLAAEAPAALAASDTPEAGVVILPEDTHWSVPEIQHFQLRYFDGQSWHRRWDSGVQGSLPVAVEIVLGLEPSFPGAGPSDETVPGQAVRSALDSGSLDPTDPGPLGYRQVVYLRAARQVVDGSEHDSQADTLSMVTAGQSAAGHSTAGAGR